MSKGSGSTRRSAPTQTVQQQPALSHNYSEQESAEKLKDAQIFTSNIYGTKDNYTAQQKLDFVIDSNRLLNKTGFEGFKVRALSIEDNGELRVSRVGILVNKAAMKQLNEYAYISVPYGTGQDYFEVEFQGAKFRTTDLSNIKEQARYAWSKKVNRRTPIDKKLDAQIDPDTTISRPAVRKLVDNLSTVETRLYRK